MAKKQKMSAKQRAARLKAAQEREARIAAEKARKERIKKIGVIIVCVILVLALGIPSVALIFLSAGA